MTDSTFKNHTGVLLINIGSPRTAAVPDVKAYLSEFLMDEHVIDIPWLARLLLVRGLIAPRRAAYSAGLYRQVMTPAGLPLTVQMQALKNSLQEMMAADGYRIAIGMHYGTPSLAEGIASLMDQQVSAITVVPLYPQETLSTTKSALSALQRLCNVIKPQLPINVVEPFFAHDGYIDAEVNCIATQLKQQKPDALLFSYHNIPRRHLNKVVVHRKCQGLSGELCQACELENSHCYFAQCFMTTKLIADRLGFTDVHIATSFQSNLGNPKKWLSPQTDAVIRDLAQQGIKNLVVVCPGFVVDCLETLLDLGKVGREIFLAHGGASYQLIPALGVSPAWCTALANMIKAGGRRPL